MDAIQIITASREKLEDTLNQKEYICVETDSLLSYQNVYNTLRSRYYIHGIDVNENQFTHNGAIITALTPVKKSAPMTILFVGMNNDIESFKNPIEAANYVRLKRQLVY